MNHQFYPRLFLFMVAFAWGVALSAQPRVEVRLATAESSDTIFVPLQLAGLPRPDAAPGQRIFFTVQADVFAGDSLLIAAGARAKGWIRAIRYTDAMLDLAVEMEAVQTVEGEMAGVAREYHTFGITLCLNARVAGKPNLTDAGKKMANEYVER